MSAVRLVSTADMDRAEWLKQRSRGIGGSDIAAIAGVSRFGTPLSVYLDKVGESKDRDETDAMYWGTVLEDVVATEYARRHPDYQIRRRNAILRHPETSFFLANIDREIRRAGHPPMLLEIKTSSAWMAGNWREDVPDYVMCQVQWYLGVLGERWQTAVVAVLVGGNDYREIEIARDDEIIDYLQTIGRQFWEDHVVPRVRPEAGPTDGGTIADMYPEDDGSEIDITPQAGMLLRQYDEAKAAADAAEARLSEIENKIKLLVGEAERAWVGARQVRWPTITSRRVNTPKLRDERPDIYEQYTRESSYRRFTITREDE